ncbi:PaaI family thioesterase [Microbacterium sp. zg-Y818]|uniref:PaaI family thioesterase n=1 Tax=unclassified Microbacterium TaxID=2609290 RepID=UPI00214ADF36|nr:MULTISPECIES: PaaI family thioesterase [unclassified Microbacterium]MCR2799305.1 PaaI family thioesterase [Microbacterium sp. zg.Y818]WIM21306.1 PaaI family thioesterase [Microbacterium sp. zg-Y818]
MTAERPLDAAHVDDALRLTVALRDLADTAVRSRPGAHTAAAAEQIEAVVAQLEQHTVDDVLPWSYALDPMQKQLLVRLSGGDPASSAGRAWSSFNPIAPPVDMVMDGEEHVGRVSLGAAFTGPPGRVHGGTVATVLDHAMGALLFHLGRPSFTARLEIDYLAAAPLGAPLDLRANVERVDGRKSYVRATVSIDGAVAARATGLFLTMAR